MDYRCTLCKGEFKDPRLLDCYHSFCRFCLDEYLMVNYDDGRFSCPLCREYNSVPVNGARGLPKNKFIDLEQNNSRINCDLCQHKVKASSVCRDCKQNLCRACLINHISEQGSQFHNVISLTDGEKQKDACPTHKKQALLYYCDTCEKPICNACNMTDHKSHRSKDITSMSGILRQQLGSYLQAMTVDADVSSIQSKVSEQQRKIKAYQEDVIAAIDERTKELHRLIDEVRGEFVRKVVSENADNKKLLEDNLDVLNTNVAAIEEIRKFGQHFLEHSCDIDAVRHIPKMQKKIKKLQNIDVQITEIKQKVFYPSQTDISNLEIQKIFGSFEKLNRRPKEIKSISRLSELRRANSDGGPQISGGISHRSYSNGMQRSSSDNIHRPSEEISGRKYNKEPFTCSNGIVTGLTFLSDDSVCVCIGNEGILETFSSSGRRRSHQTFQHPVDDIVANKKDTVFISSNFEKKIFKLSNEKKEVFAETRHCVRGLAFDDNGSLIAGMTEQDSYFDSHQDGYVTEISKQNKIKRVVEDSRIRYPARIAIGYDQRIIISDWIQLSVAIFREDRILATYNGSRDFAKEFIPRGICTLSNNDVIVVDIAANALHWLSPQCKLRRVITVGDSAEPWSVTADRDDTVWVGTQDGRIIPVDLF